MKKLTLSIAKPCNNDWDEMTANEKGRHCSSCNKTVIDFSTYTDKELVGFFKNIPQGICGHIPKYKLDTLLVAQENKSNFFFKKLFWGTALASWFGLVNKAEAKNTPKPNTELTVKNLAKRNIEAEYKDTLKKSVSLSFYDASSKKVIPYVDVTLMVNGSSEESYAAYNGVCTVPLNENMIGKSIVLYCSSSEYAGKEFALKISSLPMSKKIYLTFQPRHIMVNGGLAARPQDR
ncbi:MAG TPA: hypothetical protein VNZ45_06120 [Bacteroidia bacterium]|jgi:hypothetical protein|nr:hypothetical protein [Bacteroidia bacterium]